MDRRMPVLERLAGFALPRGERDEILADLHEEWLSRDDSRSPGWVARQSLCIAARYQGECYRDPDDHWRIMAVLALAVALLWIVPAATVQLLNGADVFTTPVMRAIVHLWRASHVSSSVAAGLLVGRIAILPDHTGAARWHIVSLLAAVCIATNGLAAGSVAGLALVSAAWLGDRSRRAVAPGEESRTAS
jgi:hypothetical protein